MPDPHQPLASGTPLPDAPIVSAAGEASTLRAQVAGRTAVVYYMRTPTCPVCNAHLRHFARALATGEYGDVPVIVLVPGGEAGAGIVSSRHAQAPFHVWGTEAAHANAGLFVKVGLQQSGTAVVDAAATVTHSTYSSIPVGSYNHAETVAAVAAQSAPVTRQAD